MHMKKFAVLSALLVILVGVSFWKVPYFRAAFPQIGKNSNGTEQTGTVTNSVVPEDPTTPEAIEKRKASDKLAMEAAQKSGESSDCGKIQDTFLKNTCTNAMVIQSALKSGEREKCSSIADERMKKACEDNFTAHDAIQNKDVSACDEIQSESQRISCKSSIYTQEAITKNDPSLCNASDPKVADSCNDNYRMNYAMQHSDPLACMNIKSAVLSEKCRSIVKKASEN